MKKITKFNDSILQDKSIHSIPNFNHEKNIKSIWKSNIISGVKISYWWCSIWNHKVSFQHLKQNLISNNTSKNTNSVNLCSTNLINVIYGNYELNSLNTPNCNTQNQISYSNSNSKSFLFVLIGIPMDGILWKDIVLSTSTQLLNHYTYVFRKGVMVPMMLEIHVKHHFPTTNISRKEWIY